MVCGMGNSDQSSHTCSGKLQREQMSRNTEETERLGKMELGTDQREQSGDTVRWWGHVWSQRSKCEKREGRRRKGQKVRIRYLPFKESTCQVDADEDHCLLQIVLSWGSSNRDGSDWSFIDCKERKVMSACKLTVATTDLPGPREPQGDQVFWTGVQSKALGCKIRPPAQVLCRAHISDRSQIWGKHGFPLLWFSSGCHNKIPLTGWLKEQTFFPHSFGVWEVHYQGALLACLIPAESPLAGPQVAALLLYPHMAEKEIMACCFSSYKGTDNICEGSTHDLINLLPKNLPAMWDTWVQSLGWEDPLEKRKTTHSSILAWRIPWTV